MAFPSTFFLKKKNTPITPGTILIGTKTRASGLHNPTLPFPYNGTIYYVPGQNFYVVWLSGTGFIDVARINRNGAIRLVFDLGGAGLSNVSGSGESTGRSKIHHYRGGISIQNWSAGNLETGVPISSYDFNFNINVNVQNGDIFKWEYGTNRGLPSGGSVSGASSDIKFYTEEGNSSAITIL